MISVWLAWALAGSPPALTLAWRPGWQATVRTTLDGVDGPAVTLVTTRERRNILVTWGDGNGGAVNLTLYPDGSVRPSSPSPAAEAWWTAEIEAWRGLVPGAARPIAGLATDPAALSLEHPIRWDGTATLGSDPVPCGGDEDGCLRVVVDATIADPAYALALVLGDVAHAGLQADALTPVVRSARVVRREERVVDARLRTWSSTVTTSAEVEVEVAGRVTSRTRELVQTVSWAWETARR